MSNALPPITVPGLAALSFWLAQTMAGEVPDHDLLARTLPHGRIRRASVERDSAGPFVAAAVVDQRDGKERKPRLFDPIGFFVLRTLLIPKASIRIDRNVLSTKPERHFLCICDDITVLRVVADAKPGEVVHQLGDHHDLRRSNLTVSQGASSDPGRETALTRALASFDTREAELRKRAPITREQFEWMVKTAFELLDRVPLGSK